MKKLDEGQTGWVELRKYLYLIKTTCCCSKLSVIDAIKCNYKYFTAMMLMVIIISRYNCA